MAFEYFLIDRNGKKYQLNVGETFLGRGDEFDIKDKKCSRKQLKVNVNKDGTKVTITPVSFFFCLFIF